jgi:hypothetical protein
MGLYRNRQRAIKAGALDYKFVIRGRIRGKVILVISFNV